MVAFVVIVIATDNLLQNTFCQLLSCLYYPTLLKRWRVQFVLKVEDYHCNMIDNQTRKVQLKKLKKRISIPLGQE